MLSVLLCLAAAFQPHAPLFASHNQCLLCDILQLRQHCTACPHVKWTIVYHYTSTRSCSADTAVDLCKTLARWGRGAAQKKMMPTFDTSAGPSSSQPIAVGESAAKHQTASSSAPKELDTECVVHVQSSPIADLEREEIFVRPCYKDIFARIWRLTQLWIQCRKAKLATRGNILHWIICSSGTPLLNQIQLKQSLASTRDSTLQEKCTDNLAVYPYA